MKKLSAVQSELLSRITPGIQTKLTVTKRRRVSVEALQNKGFLDIIDLEVNERYLVYTLYRYTETGRVVMSQLMESTGAHFLDSGGSSGRMWQRNQAKGRRGIREEYISNLEPDVWEDRLHPMITHNIFHWMTEKLTYDSDGQELWDEYYKTNEDTNLWDFCEWLKEVKGYRVKGIYNSGNPIVDNTYNSENYLSQDLLYAYITIESDDYENDYYHPENLVFISVHNGADVRGGYTSVKCYTENNELDFFEYNRAVIYTDSDESVVWYSDGMSFNNDDGIDSINRIPVVELESVCVKEPVWKEERVNDNKWVESSLVSPGEYEDPEIPEDSDTIYVYDGKAYFQGNLLQSAIN